MGRSVLRMRGRPGGKVANIKQVAKAAKISKQVRNKPHMGSKRKGR